MAVPLVKEIGERDEAVARGVEGEVAGCEVVVRAALAAGVKLVQVREKSMHDRAVLNNPRPIKGPDDVMEILELAA